jgi:hypothetical protein
VGATDDGLLSGQPDTHFHDTDMMVAVEDSDSTLAISKTVWFEYFADRQNQPNGQALIMPGRCGYMRALFRHFALDSSYEARSLCDGSRPPRRIDRNAGL